MSAKTKIVVLKMKELIYTAIFIGLAALLIVLLFLMFRPRSDARPLPSAENESVYIPGVYSCALSLSGQSANLIVCVDDNHINRIYLENLEETVETLYPLVPSVLSSLSAQILSAQSLEAVTYSTYSQYTSELLLNAVSSALQKAVPAD